MTSTIAELGAGGAMSDFCWNGGEYFKGKPWAEHLPTDAAVSGNEYYNFYKSIYWFFVC